MLETFYIELNTWHSKGTKSEEKSHCELGNFLPFTDTSLPLLLLFANFFSVKSGDTMFSILIGDEGNEI